ncbi:hypothetical protein [Sporosarcina cyprini]|uniref:hypothetical protein n=1 Tax=Sporosarcina cyprini TaxID=2910523 RepID=UPI001EDFDB90|nr:hypothetical protein [Sporosarcina cyprini]MCG3089542.1 hypothetical protein [Sporosarcina cyprini]
MLEQFYEWFGGRYEQLLKYTSGSTADTSGHRIIRVVRQQIRAVTGLYECFDSRYERLI